jgi:hypothetical protein
MMLKRTQVINRPASDVFATISEAGEFAKWNPTIKASRRLDEGQIGNGSRFEWTLRGFGNVAQVFEEFQLNKQLRIVPQMKAVRGGHRFILTDQGGQTRVDHELEMIPQGLFKLMTPMMRKTGERNLRDTAEALKATLESGA